MLKTIKIMLGLLCLLSGCAAKTTISDSLESLPVGYYEGTGFLVDHDRRLVLINTGQGGWGRSVCSHRCKGWMRRTGNFGLLMKTKCLR